MSLKISDKYRRSDAGTRRRWAYGEIAETTENAYCPKCKEHRSVLSSMLGFSKCLTCGYVFSKLSAQVLRENEEYAKTSGSVK